MRKFRVLTFILFFGRAILLIAAGDAVSQSLDNPPIPDLSAPERALRSYWALYDWHWVSGLREGIKTKSQEAFETSMSQITLGQTRQFFQALDASRQANLQMRLQRTITSNTQESPTRVVILANVKNVSRIPADAKATPYLIRLRETGVDFKYVLELDENQWKVLEIWYIRDFGTLRMYQGSEPIYPADVPGN